MAEKVGDAYVQLGTRDGQLTTGLNRGLKAVQGFALAASGIFAVVAAGRGISGLVGAYSDAIETTNKFNEVFNGAAQDINKAADELADSYGLIGTSSRKLLADTGDILVGFGFAEDAALDLAVSANKLAVDLASFTNIEGGAARASQALTKALVGETEQAKALGIVIRQNSKEFKDIVARLQKAEGKTILQAKALAALEIASRQTQKAQGDYARTQDQLANQMRMTGERTKELKEAAGGLVVRFTSANGKVMSFNDALKELSQRLRDVTGAQVETTRETAVFVAQLTAALLIGKKLTPVVATLATNITAMAAQDGLAAAIGKASLLTAAAAGIAAITVELVKMRHATNQLLESEDNLSGTLDEQEKKFGTRSVARLRRMRLELIAAGEEFGIAGGAGRGGPPPPPAAKKDTGPSFAFASFEDAIRNIQTSLGKGDEQKKQTNLLGDISNGIQTLVKQPQAAVVGV